MKKIHYGWVSFLLCFIVYCISLPIMGRLIDSFGVRRIISYSALLVGISTSLTFFVASFWQIILLYGIISSMGFGGASALGAYIPGLLYDLTGYTI